MQIIPATRINMDKETIGVSYLIINNAKKSDSGDYLCRIEDHSKNSASFKYKMTILGKSKILLVPIRTF